ncbi:helix-hairpin-helix domain-containing protein [Paenibacillus athensensis]|uniref:Helix-hairpin-helix domain-containing protein n=1 Tax=Paenibacillus athensensis TaxID=1967502 RepID=A0A4Y8Q4K3_9BACL|nr:helix-hairpin-helix domain-containing protein [Paenibacillus athensensis]MCD1260787.1 helix-hairpin-helix domain-containing protein [Paenibacillus athensensis]
METERKSIFWKLGHSWWIVLTFVPVYNFFAFLYLALMVRSWRYALWSAVYVAPYIILFTIAVDGNTGFLFNLVMALALLSTGVCILHGFFSIGPYLRRLENLQREARRQAQPTSPTLEPGRKEASLAEAPADPDSRETDAPSPHTSRGSGTWITSKSAASPASVVRPTPDPIRQTDRDADRPDDVSLPAEPLDLNAASEQAIAALPGIGLILAKKALQARQASNGFRSVDEFAEALGLEPQVLERLRPLVAIRPPASPPPPSGGRVVDF